MGTFLDIGTLSIFGVPKQIKTDSRSMASQTIQEMRCESREYESIMSEDSSIMKMFEWSLPYKCNLCDIVRYKCNICSARKRGSRRRNATDIIHISRLARHNHQFQIEDNYSST